MIQAQATARYVRTSAQKAKLVLDQIRGRDVNAALAILRFTPKSVARDIEKVLRSAVANAHQREGFGGDPDRLYVSACYADQGPSMKRIRPAPMGRAFRVLKRTAHLTVQVTERPAEFPAVAEMTPAEAVGAPAPAAEPGPNTSARTAKTARAKTRAKKRDGKDGRRKTGGGGAKRHK